MKLKNRINEIMLEQGFSRTDLIKFLNINSQFKISRQLMYGYLNNHYQPKKSIVRQVIAKFLNRPPNEIFYQENHVKN